MDYELFKICVSCAVFGWCWVDVLTPDRALLGWVKRFYPLTIQKPLTCAHCLSGWLSLLVSCIYFICNYELCNYVVCLYIVLSPFFTMAIVECIKNKG